MFIQRIKWLIVLKFRVKDKATDDLMKIVATSITFNVKLNELRAKVCDFIHEKLPKNITLMELECIQNNLIQHVYANKKVHSVYEKRSSIYRKIYYPVWYYSSNH